jgi:hypothetical protein
MQIPLSFIGVEFFCPDCGRGLAKVSEDGRGLEYLAAKAGIRAMAEVNVNEGTGEAVVIEAVCGFCHPEEMTTDKRKENDP